MITLNCRSSALIGCISLLLCASITVISAFHAEAILEVEPSLRGLVHVGVMVLFAWICVEPYFTSRNFLTVTNTSIDSNEANRESEGSSLDHHITVTDSQGIGIAFAGFGCFFLAMFPFTISISQGLLDISSGSGFDLSNLFLLIFSLFMMIISCAILKSLFPQISKIHLRNFATIISFLLGAAISLCDTSLGTLSRYPFCLGDSFYHCHNNLSEISEKHLTWSMLILDYMAYVFHRAFIASLLVGAGFGPGSNYTASKLQKVNYYALASCNEQMTVARRLDLRCRYRSYFCLVAFNMGLSWIFCGIFYSPISNTYYLEYEQGIKNIFLIIYSSRQKGIFQIIGGGLVFLSGVLQINEVFSFQERQFDLGWSWDIPNITKANVWKSFPGTGNRDYMGYGETFCLLSFFFYACTLFADGIVLRKAGTSGFDDCLIRAVHVAAVFGAMVAIFPRLLRANSSFNPIENKGFMNKWNNTIMKVTVASMSTIDTMICSWLIIKRKNPSYDIGYSTKVTTLSISFRIVGAILQALSYSNLKVKSSVTTCERNGGKVKYTKVTNEYRNDFNASEFDASHTSLPATDSKFKSPKCSETRGGTGENHYLNHIDKEQMLLNHEKNNIFTVSSWMLYLCTHFIHSLVHATSTNAQDLADSVLFPAEIQLSKIFHFQVITLGFATTSIFRKNETCLDVTMIFLFLEIAGILNCSELKISFFNDRIYICLTSTLLLLDCLRRKICYTENTYLDMAALEKKDLLHGVGNTMFPS